MQLTRLTTAAATVRETQVVEDQQLPGPQRDTDLDPLDIDSEPPKERELCRQAAELGAAKE